MSDWYPRKVSIAAYALTDNNKKKSQETWGGIWFECNLVRMQTRDRYVIGLMCRELHCTLWAVQMSQEAGIVQGAIKGKAVKVWKADLQKILHWFRKPV